MCDVNDRQLALAVYLGVSLADIEVSTWDDNTLIVNPRTVKQGDPPEKYQRWAADLHAFLEEHSLDVATWQQLIPEINDREYERYLVGQLEARWGNKVLGSDPETAQANGHRMEFLRKTTTRHQVAYELLKRKMVGWGEFPQKEGEIHWYANGFYHLLATEDKDADQWHVYALRTAFNGDRIIDRREDMDVDDGEYMVLTDDEADEVWDDILENNIDEIVLPEVPEQWRSYFDREAWKNDARNDGRGHALSSYDGEESEINLNDTELDTILKLIQEYCEEQDEEFDQEYWEDNYPTGSFYIYRIN